MIRRTIRRLSLFTAMWPLKLAILAVVVLGLTGLLTRASACGRVEGLRLVSTVAVVNVRGVGRYIVTMRRLGLRQCTKLVRQVMQLLTLNPFRSIGTLWVPR